METQETESRQRRSMTKEERNSEITQKWARRIMEGKAEMIRKCAQELLENDNEPKSICAILKHDWKGMIGERTIEKALGPEFKMTKTAEDRTNADIDDNNAIEEDARKLRESLGIDEDEEPLTEDRYMKLKEKIQILTDERNFYRDQMNHYKNLVEAKQEINDIKEGNEVVIFADCYEEVADMMKKCPNGLVLQHDGYNVFKWRKLASVKKPANQKAVTSEDVNL